VLVHGLLGYSFCFRQNLPVLAQSATVYAIDLPGTGFSERPALINGDLRALAGMLLTFVRQLKLERPVFLGSSHGGAVVLMAAGMAAAQQNVKLGPMILVAPVNPWSRNGRRRVKIAASAAGSAALRVIAPLLSPLHGYFLRRMYGDPSRLTSEAIKGYSDAIRERGTMAQLIGRVAHWNEDLQLLERALPACMGVPSLVIWGDRDCAVDPASAEELLRRLPKAELAIIRGAGHLPFEEEPEQFNELVLNFLARQRTGVYS
jgi:pimeloyl-ACP methyl ester carboxylesterase